MLNATGTWMIQKRNPFAKELGDGHGQQMVLGDRDGPETPTRAHLGCFQARLGAKSLWPVTGTIKKTPADPSISMLFEGQPHFGINHILASSVISQLIFNSGYSNTQILAPLQAEKDREKQSPCCFNFCRAG